MAQCKARSKRSQVQCKNDSIVGSTTCRMHGGKVQSGVLAKSFKHGRYAKSMQGRLLAHYEENVPFNDVILEMVDELNLLDSRINELVEEASKDGGSTFEIALEKMVDLHNVIQLGFPVDKILEEYHSVETILHSGWNTQEIWDNILKALEHRRKIAEVEAKRIHLSHTNIPINQARDLIRRLGEAYKHAVLRYADGDIANKILTEASAESARLYSS